MYEYVGILGVADPYDSATNQTAGMLHTHIPRHPVWGHLHLHLVSRQMVEGLSSFGCLVGPTDGCCGTAWPKSCDFLLKLPRHGTGRSGVGPGTPNPAGLVTLTQPTKTLPWGTRTSRVVVMVSRALYSCVSPSALDSDPSAWDPPLLPPPLGRYDS